MKIIRSVLSEQEDIINFALKLHANTDQIDLDPTFSKGNFYKSGMVKQPTFKYDLHPKYSDVNRSDSRALPFGDATLNTIIFDPPFVISGKTYPQSAKGTCGIQKRYSCYFTFEELKDHYYNSLLEFYRILKPNGIVIFKLQNTISSGKQHFTHFYTMKSAVKVGFYPIDEFVLPMKSKMTSFGGRWNVQRHAMKYHCFFLVFKKTRCKVNYE